MHTDISTAGSPLSVHLLCVLPLSVPSLHLSLAPAVVDAEREADGSQCSGGDGVG